MIASKIVEGRTKKGWSLSDLSKETGIHRQTIYGYEKGVKPSRKNLEKIAKALNVPVEHFFTDDSGKSNLIVPAVRKELERKLKEALELSAADQDAIIKVIDLAIEKRKLSKKLQDIAQHAI